MIVATYLTIIVDRIEVRLIIKEKNIKQRNFPEENIQNYEDKDVFYFPILEFSIWLIL